MLARRRLETANEVLRVAHARSLRTGTAVDRATSVQRAQELVVTIEQEVALLSQGLGREYPDADSSYTASRSDQDGQ